MDASAVLATSEANSSSGIPVSSKTGDCTFVRSISEEYIFLTLFPSVPERSDSNDADVGKFVGYVEKTSFSKESCGTAVCIG